MRDGKSLVDDIARCSRLGLVLYSADVPVQQSALCVRELSLPRWD